MTSSQTPPFACPCCSGSTALVVRGRDYNWRVDSRTFDIRRCDSCGFRFTADPPADLARYYTKNHYSRPDMAANLERFAEGERYKLNLVKRFSAGKTLMEIGPSMGAFCKLAVDDGYAVAAIEMDRDCVAFLNEQLGVRAIQSLDAASVLNAEGRAYDVITMWHALEHMARPWEVIAACARHLTPGGVLVIAVPNPESLQASVMGARWPHYDLPRHLSHLTTGWLTATAAKAGLACELVTTRDEGSLSVTTQSIPLWLLALTGARADKGGLSRLMASLCWRIGRLAAKIAAPFDAREGRGAAYTAVFRKTA